MINRFAGVLFRAPSGAGIIGWFASSDTHADKRNGGSKTNQAYPDDVFQLHWEFRCDWEAPVAAGLSQSGRGLLQLQNHRFEAGAPRQNLHSSRASQQKKAPQTSSTGPR